MDFFEKLQKLDQSKKKLFVSGVIAVLALLLGFFVIWDLQKNLNQARRLGFIDSIINSKKTQEFEEKKTQLYNEFKGLSSQINKLQKDLNNLNTTSNSTSSENASKEQTNQ